MTNKTTPSKKPSTKEATSNNTPVKKPEEPTLKIISTSKTQTISGKSTITYNVGTDDEAHLFIRILSNTGGGFFSNEWILMDAIKTILGGIPSNYPITSQHLTPLFKGKSVNTSGYLLAALVNEKMLAHLEGKKRHFSYTGNETTAPKTTKPKTSKKASN